MALVFGTRGPDCYSDGTSVRPGEFYALVWAREGSEFAGIDLNGNAVDTTNNLVIGKWPLAQVRRDGKGVHCQFTIFNLNSAFYVENGLSNGVFSLVLLDTRRTSLTEDGTLEVSDNADTVNGWGFASKSRVRVSEPSQFATVNESDVADSATTTTESAIPEEDANIPKPKITGIKVENGFVTLTVKGTSPRLMYNVAAGSHPGRINKRGRASKPVSGRESAEREIKIIMPVREGERFFKVTRH